MKSTLGAPLNEDEIMKIKTLCLSAGLEVPESALEAYQAAERLIEHGFAIRRAVYTAWGAANQRQAMRNRVETQNPDGAAILKELGL